jgi:WD40 repeat protein
MELPLLLDALYILFNLGETLISVALGGWINYLDRNNPSTPKRMLYGHMKNISGLCLGKNGSTFYSACQGGLICVWYPFK